MVSKFFEPGSGPRRHALDNKNKLLHILAERARRGVSEAAAAAARFIDDAPQESESILHTRMERKRTAALEKARMTLESAPKRSRTIEFSS